MISCAKDGGRSQVKRELTESGHLSKGIKQLLLDNFGLSNNRLVNLCNSLTPKEDNAENKQVPGTDADDDRKHAAIRLINTEIEQLELFCQHAALRLQYDCSADVRSRSLPSTEKADRLLRYETQFERQLYRAMDQLERLQRRRMGDVEPPPLNVTFGRYR